MAQPNKRLHGTRNNITDVPGIYIGNHTDHEILSGVTVVIPDDRSTAGVNVMGGAPGTRETDLLDSMNLVQKVDAILLSGGSAFGLSVADGVMRFLEESGRGYPAREGVIVPIVPAAILYDLYRGSVKSRVNASHGYEACEHLGHDCLNGNYGAGTGAIAGGIKGGLGTASEILPNGASVGAVVAVNSAGYVADPVTGGIFARYLELGSEFNDLPSLPFAGDLTYPLTAKLGQNTVIAVVATDLTLNKAECNRVAKMAHDGIARAIRPSHTMFDGDTIFALSTKKQFTNNRRGFIVSLIGHTAADVLSRAIVHAVINAKSVSGIQSYWDKFKDVLTHKHV
jgi:L-aminopeptidase/D-esterase-like protein